MSDEAKPTQLLDNPQDCFGSPAGGLRVRNAKLFGPPCAFLPISWRERCLRSALHFEPCPALLRFTQRATCREDCGGCLTGNSASLPCAGAGCRV